MSPIRFVPTVWLVIALGISPWLASGGDSELEVGLAVRDISPKLPIRLAGYDSRNRPADRADQALQAQALAFRNSTGERFVLVTLDNCEVSRDFTAPVLRALADQCQLGPGTVAVVASHTHSAPVLAATLPGMTQPAGTDGEAIQNYTVFLQQRLIEVAMAALTNFQPATLEFGSGQACFAMNRRVYRADHVAFGDNPDGPVDWDVPVLRMLNTNGTVRAILFGYACHGTSVRDGDDWYTVSGEYMAYAREHLQAMYPGVVALYVPGMGADSDPAPRGPLLAAKRHGLELAGAVEGVLAHPMKAVRGPFRLAWEEVGLPLVDAPARDQIEKDATSQDKGKKARAALYIRLINEGKPLPKTIPLSVAVLRFGGDLTFVMMGGEVVVDYSKRLKRLLADQNPWMIGYAYDVPSYIPSVRILKEGGYEAEDSLAYYGVYGPFRGEIEELLITRVTALVKRLRTDSVTGR